MKLGRTFTYKTFNPAINDFDSEYNRIYKEVDKKTARTINLFRALTKLCVVICFLSVISSVAFGACYDGGVPWCLFVCFGCMAIFLLGIWGGVNADSKADWLEEYFEEINFDDEENECEAHNAEQEKIANEWRQAHPFEEKIRMAKTRGSSVDIAEMVKEYIKLQKGE